MAFVSNSGATAVSPFSPTLDRYIQLSHPTVPDVLLLQQMPSDGNGYALPQLTGLLASQGRTTTAALVVTRARANKLEWLDMSFVVTKQQADLFDRLLLAQTGAAPVTLVDNETLEYLTKLVAIVPASTYKSQYSGLTMLLIQFALLEV